MEVMAQNVSIHTGASSNKCSFLFCLTIYLLCFALFTRSQNVEGVAGDGVWTNLYTAAVVAAVWHAEQYVYH
jgi:hypothetical protein